MLLRVRKAPPLPGAGETRCFVRSPAGPSICCPVGSLVCLISTTRARTRTSNLAQIALALAQGPDPRFAAPRGSLAVVVAVGCWLLVEGHCGQTVDCGLWEARSEVGSACSRKSLCCLARGKSQQSFSASALCLMQFHSSPSPRSHRRSFSQFYLFYLNTLRWLFAISGYGMGLLSS